MVLIVDDKLVFHADVNAATFDLARVVNISMDYVKTDFGGFVAGFYLKIWHTENSAPENSALKFWCEKLC